GAAGRLAACLAQVWWAYRPRSSFTLGWPAQLVPQKTQTLSGCSAIVVSCAWGPRGGPAYVTETARATQHASRRSARRFSAGGGAGRATYDPALNPKQRRQLEEDLAALPKRERDR